MKIGITINNISYTPEAYAYEKYLTKLGHCIQLDLASNLDPNNDINIYFMGFRPFWVKEKGKALEIHEYQSLSTGTYPRVKNLMKKIINKKPVGRIFLNSIVKSEFGFIDDVPSICRDMGVDDSFFQVPSNNPKYDIVYCGSVNGRIGLVEILSELSKKYKIIVIGDVDMSIKNHLISLGISFTGRLDRKDIPTIYADARFGLNYTPNIYPFNIQTSTKTLEYLASGLNVISNRYFWAETFFKQLSYTPIWIEQMDLEKNSSLPNMDGYAWKNVLDKSNFEKFILSSCL